MSWLSIHEFGGKNRYNDIRKSTLYFVFFTIEIFLACLTTNSFHRGFSRGSYYKTTRVFVY